MDTDVYESNFCPSATLAANNTFQTPTGPTLLIVRHIEQALNESRVFQCEAQDDSWVGFHLLILLSIVLVFGIAYGNRTRLSKLKAYGPHQKSNAIYLVWVAGFEPAASDFQGRPSTRLTIYPEKPYKNVFTDVLKVPYYVLEYVFIW